MVDRTPIPPPKVLEVPKRVEPVKVFVDENGREMKLPQTHFYEQLIELPKEDPQIPVNPPKPKTKGEQEQGMRYQEESGVPLLMTKDARLPLGGKLPKFMYEEVERTLSAS